MTLKSLLFIFSTTYKLSFPIRCVKEHSWLETIYTSPHQSLGLQHRNGSIQDLSVTILKLNHARMALGLTLCLCLLTLLLYLIQSWKKLFLVRLAGLCSSSLSFLPHFISDFFLICCSNSLLTSHFSSAGSCISSVTGIIFLALCSYF